MFSGGYKNVTLEINGLRDSMIANFTENRFLQQVQKIELINWDWLKISLYCSKETSKNKQLQYGNILPRNHLSYLSVN